MCVEIETGLLLKLATSEKKAVMISLKVFWGISGLYCRQWRDDRK